MRREHTLGIESRGKRIPRPPKREEGVTLRIDLLAVVRSEREPKDPLMLSEDFAVSDALLFEQPR
jgi:hypothetical protein